MTPEEDHIAEESANVTRTLSFTTDAIIVRAWDGASLTLAGVLYGIVVTIAGVIVAALRWWIGSGPGQGEVFFS